MAKIYLKRVASAGNSCFDKYLNPCYFYERRKKWRHKYCHLRGYNDICSDNYNHWTKDNKVCGEGYVLIKVRRVETSDATRCPHGFYGDGCLECQGIEPKIEPKKKVDGQYVGWHPCSKCDKPVHGGRSECDECYTFPELETGSFEDLEIFKKLKEDKL